ncbi:Up-regulated during septation-domain-containing protein [Rhexocercosporidium sp. MPI-PUGE-AT-0058]|nr:Up-regulated during septation-domain-containing protein [Rhexocercosporidium sp. MPI-PUGE-AT-0058]
MNGFEEKPRYNPMNPTRPQSSTLLNVNDPIQIHLLVETALGDSKEYEILSQEEVDDLKKQCQVLTQRIEQTRQNLAIQSKYRDAAISMAKLYSPSDRKDGQDGRRDRRSIFGHNRNSSESVKEADQERIASEKKCEELALELWSLEKRLMEPQSRLLKHTAGILQMTHKGPTKVPKGQGSSQQQGIPGSPESMYTYSNARSSMEPIHDEIFFDERSLYRPADRLDGFDIGGRDSFVSSKGPSKEQMQMIANTEQKLESLNSRLREVIIKANPEREATYGAPPLCRTDRNGKPSEAGTTLQSHLEYLEQSINTIDQESVGQSTRVQEQSEAAMEETLQELNSEIRNLLLPYDSNRPEPPKLTGNGLNEQLGYFQEIIGAVEVELSRASSTASKSMGTSDNLEQMQTVMMGLWDIIQSGEEDQRQRKAERRQTRIAQNLPQDEEDSPDEGDDPNENFSIQAFSTKVQWLYSQATRLKDQKKVLQRQIKQQRELNNKSDAAKDAELVQKSEELQRTQDLLTRTEADANNVRQQLSDMMEKLDETNQRVLMRDQSRSDDESAAVREAREELSKRNELNGRNETIAALEEELQDLKDDQSIGNAELQGKMADSASKIASLTQELAAAAAAQATFEKGVQEKEQAIAAKEKEMEEMNMEIARLQTEVTIARAELDGAYGSRAQRAAEVAANPAIQKEIDTLTKSNSSLAAEIAALKEKGTSSPDADAKMATLKKELEETIEEYEQMTKASIEWEKERESLEGTIDKLRDERENLEAQLSDEKVRWLGMKSPGLEGGGGLAPGSTSTTVLKNEFKKMMRDTRAESAKALRAEQAERRRLEDELRALKKAQGPGKSSLSQSYGA